MPSVKKILHFISSALSCAGGAGLMGYGMAAEWSRSSIKCNMNGTGEVIVGLFEGSVILTSCPFIDTSQKIEVMNDMVGVPLILQYIVVASLILSLIGSSGSILITLYNSVSNPYQTYMGPVGLYACSGFSVGMSLLALIIYVSYVHLTGFAEDLVLKFAAGAELSSPTITMGLGFFLVLPYAAVNILAIVLVYLFVHAAYTQKREQQKPTEDTPKEIMMY